MGDTGNALLAAIAITMALYHRDRTGEGQAVSTSIVNAGLLHTSYAWIHADGSRPDWGHVDGDQFGLSPYYRLYQCADGGWVFLAAVTQDAAVEAAALLPGAPAEEDAEQVAAWLDVVFRGAQRSTEASRPSTTAACRSSWSTRVSAATCSTTRRPGGWTSSARRGRAASGDSRIPACWSMSLPPEPSSNGARARAGSTPGRSCGSWDTPMPRSTPGRGPGGPRRSGRT